MVRSSVLFGGLLARGERCPHAAFAPTKKSSQRTALLRTSVSSDFLRLTLLVRLSVLFGELLAGRQCCSWHSLDLRSLLIEQHFSLTRYSICFRKTFLSFYPQRHDSGILDCRHSDECTALFSEIGARHSMMQIPCKTHSCPPNLRMLKVSAFMRGYKVFLRNRQLPFLRARSLTRLRLPETRSKLSLQQLRVCPKGRRQSTHVLPCLKKSAARQAGSRPAR